MEKTYKIKSKVYLYPGMAGWHFAGLPKKESGEIKKNSKVKAGFGSVPVMVTIGKTKWKTSVFPDKKSGCYLLPLKAGVRKKEEIFADDIVSITLQLF